MERFSQVGRIARKNSIQMKKLFTVLFLVAGVAAMGQSSDILGGLKKRLSGGTGSSLSSDDIVGGLKQALTLGAQKSADRLSLENGFLKDKAVEILMPEQAQKVEKTLRNLGLGKLVDDAITHCLAFR